MARPRLASMLWAPETPSPTAKLGTAVSEAEIPVAIARLLAEPKPDPGALAAAVRGRFGRETFAAGVSTSLNRLIEGT